MGKTDDRLARDWLQQDKIDELQAKVKELEQEKQIIELQLKVAQLEAEVAALRAQPIYVPCPYPVYPDTTPYNPWRWYTYVTCDRTDSSGSVTYTVESQAS